MVIKGWQSSLSQWIASRPQQWKWTKNTLFILVFILSLTGFLHWREARIDHLIVNTVADKYILAQVGFEFPDHEVSDILKGESLRDLGKIYSFNDDEIIKVEKQIQAELIEKPQWRKTLPTTTFEELVSANDAIRDLLIKVRFTDERTLKKLEQLGLLSQSHLAYSPQLLKDVLPEEVWKEVEQAAFSSSNPTSQYVLQQYRTHPWSMHEDFELLNEARRLIKGSIPFKMTKVEPGSRIINAGDKIAPRHITMLEGMQKSLSSLRHSGAPWTLLGSFILATILTFIGVAYFRAVYPDLLKSFPKMALIAAIVIGSLFLAKLTEAVLVNKMSPIVDFSRYPIFVLFAALTLSILMDRGVAMVVSGFIAFFLTLILNLEYDHFLIANIVTAVTAIFLVKAVKKRKEIFVICAQIWAATIPLILATNLLEDSFWSYRLVADCVTALICVAATSILVVLILPFLEKTFGIVTDITLLESADLSHPLLRRLNVEAPGTYRHSLAVAALAEEAALAINGNAIFARVAALYHDIGKLAQPQYFTENQFSGFNMHQLLTPIESAQVIIGHVKEGIKLAQQYELPLSLQDVIREHHGTGLVYYFYHAHIEQCRLRSIAVEEGRFRYVGPTPRTRESAIIMVADSVEAASRSLDQINDKAVTDLVEAITSDKIREHQLDASGLTLEEIEVMKKALARVLVAMGHVRTPFPAKNPEPPLKPEIALARLS